MAIRNLRYGDDEILSKRAKEIDVIDDKLKVLAQDMPANLCLLLLFFFH